MSRITSQAERGTPPLLHDAEEVQRWIPHRPPMLLLDGVTSFTEGERCVSVRRVGLQDPFVQGHFPGEPIVPGVYLVENIAQTACFLVQRGVGGAAGVPVLVRIERCSFLAPVRPPADLVTEVCLVRSFGSLASYAGTCRVAGRKVCQAEIIVGRAVRETEATPGRNS